MNFRTLYDWVIKNWVSVTTGILMLAVLSAMWYYVSVELSQRRETLKRVQTDRQEPKEKLAPEAAPLESSVDGMLATPPESFKPLLERIESRQEWGEPVRDWDTRMEEVPLQEELPQRGPS